MKPARMAVIEVWNAMLRRAHRYGKAHGFMGVRNMPPSMDVTDAREKTDTLFSLDCYLAFPNEHAGTLHSAGLGLARVAQPILGQTAIRHGVPFLINRDNTI